MAKKELKDIVPPGTKVAGTKKKPGRKLGSGNKDRIIHVRVARETVLKLKWIRKNSPLLMDKKDGAIIEELIADHVLMQEVCHPGLPRFSINQIIKDLNDHDPANG